MILSPEDTFKLLKKIPASKIADLSNLSESYISQVKHGKRSASPRLVEVLSQLTQPRPSIDYVGLFFKSRSQGLSENTLEFYQRVLSKAWTVARPDTSPSKVKAYLDSVNGSLGNKHAHFRALRVFFRWLYSPKSGIKLNPLDNPMLYVDAPKLPKLILPSLTREQVNSLIDSAQNLRDKAIISLFAESGLRLSELANIRQSDIDWQRHTVRVIGKGNKEGYAPFGSRSEQHLRSWLDEYGVPPNESIWGVSAIGIQHMLQVLSNETGLPCNPHTFRRTFACLLRKAGVDTMTIKDLGRWESLEMVQRYTRSVTFEDSLKFYKAPLG
jgi:site-specific recombinase XerD